MFFIVPPVSSPTGFQTEFDSTYHDVPAPPPLPVSGTGSGRLSALETIAEDEEPEEVPSTYFRMDGIICTVGR